MIADFDIYRSAKLLLDQYGDQAGIEAASHADAMLAKGDLEGRAVWLRVIKTIGELQVEGPEGAVHRRAAIPSSTFLWHCVHPPRYKAEHN